MFIADAHCDTLYELAIAGKRPGDTVVTKERLEQGGVGIQIFALFAAEHGPAGMPYEAGRRMLAQRGAVGIPFLKDIPDSPPTRPMGVLSIEGGEILEGRLDRLDEFANEGVRMIALTWNHENEIGHPAMNGPSPGLKPFGFSLIEKMNEKRILVDVSHLNEKGFWQAAEKTTLPLVASHSNLRSLLDTPRNLWPEQAREIIRSEGFIGINFFHSFLAKEESCTMDDVIRHIDGIAALGGIRVLGFGSDFDGISRWPDGLETPADFPRLIDALLRRGYTQRQVEGIAGGNLFRVLQATRDSALKQSAERL